MKETKEFQLPEWSICYFVYGDSDYLLEDEIEQIDNFIFAEDLNSYQLTKISDSSYFSNTPAFGLSCNVVDVTFMKIK